MLYLNKLLIMQRSQTLQFIIASFIGFAFMLGGLSWISFEQISLNKEYAQLVEHTQSVLWLSEELISSMKDVETGQRGYIISGNATHLQTYREGKLKVFARLDTLKLLVADNPVQLRSLRKIEAMVKEKIKYVDYSINTTSNSQPLELNVFEKGREAMDNLRVWISTFQSNEKSLLDTRVRSKTHGQSLLPIYQIMLAVASFTLLFISFFLIYSELKNRFKFQRALENKIEELNRSNTELEQFAYVASHDLQEPLRKIRAFCDKLLVRQKMFLNEDGQETLDKISASATRMQILIDDLLNFSRLVSPKKQELGYVNLNNIIEDVLSDFSEVITQKNASFSIAKLPEIKVYSFQMRQLFLNIISNSLKYTKEGVLPKINIEYSTVQGNSIAQLSSVHEDRFFHKITVQDNGIGFEEEYCEKIFVIFQRLHNRNAYQGTGVGLAICRRVMNNHNGFIFAEGKSYDGATFSIYFPITA